jgi:hypothetical protein
LSAILDHVNRIGYPLIKSVELKKGDYTITVLNAQGKSLKLHASPSGAISAPSAQRPVLNMASAAKQLEAQGYNIIELKSTHNAYQAKVSDKGGNKFTVSVDTRTGAVNRN